MTMLLLVLCILFIPWILGKGCLSLLYRKAPAGELFFWDAFLTGVVIAVGLSEASHLAALFLHRSFSFYTMVFGLLTAAFMAAALAAVIAGNLRNSGSFRNQKTSDGRKPKAADSKGSETATGADSGENVALFFLPTLLFLTQLVYILRGSPYLQGDMTVETVLSFLHTDGIYQVNPMTGSPYLSGIPMRLKILGLPSLYGGLSSIFNLPPQEVVWHVIPCFNLMCCYGAFYCVGRCLFSADIKKLSCFLMLTGLLLWAGNYALGMTGFDVLNSGWRGVAIRNAVLIPWLISLCLRKKWRLAVLCIIAEVCIVWTFYGAGSCLLLTAGMAALERVCDKLWAKGRREAAK